MFSMLPRFLSLQLASRKISKCQKALIIDTT